LILFAALMLAVPMYRIAAAYWPQPIVEQVYPDGRVTLRESLPVFADDGIVRSRPLNASRIEFEDGAIKLGYVVAIRAGEAAPRDPPNGKVWIPAGDQCELAFKGPTEIVDWLPCGRVVEVSRPNHMHLFARIRLAFSRALPGISMKKH